MDGRPRGVLGRGFDDDANPAGLVARVQFGIQGPCVGHRVGRNHSDPSQARLAWGQMLMSEHANLGCRQPACPKPRQEFLRTLPGPDFQGYPGRVMPGHLARASQDTSGVDRLNHGAGNR